MILCKCGAQCQDNTKFCPKCGATLTPATVQSNSTVTNAQGTYNNQQANYQNNVNNNPQGYAQNSAYTNPQGNYQNNPYANQQNSYQNNPYANPQNGMPGMGQNPVKAKKTINIIGIVGGALLVLSMFLPYITASAFGETFSEALIKGGHEAYLFVGLGICAVVFSIIGNNTWVLVVGIVSSLLSVREIVEFSRQIDKNGLNGIAHRGIGFWVMIIASIVIVASGFIMKAVTKNKQA